MDGMLSYPRAGHTQMEGFQEYGETVGYVAALRLYDMG